MDGVRTYGSAKCELIICTAIPEHMRPKCRELVGLEVAEYDRRRGHARELMEQVADEADKANITLILMPMAFGDDPGMTNAQLTQWYQRRFGFMAIQAKPLIMARIPGSSPRLLTPTMLAANQFAAERRQ